MYHCGGTPYATLHLDGDRRAIEIAGAAFHACFLVHEESGFFPRGEDAVRAYDAAHAAVNAFIRIEF
jgi:hypothetical protein